MKLFKLISCFFLIFSGFLSNSFAAPANHLKNLDFPRLGMWWPDPENQSLEEIARYDFVTLFDYQSPYTAQIKAINPQIVLLNSTNACELGYDESVTDIPAEWFLTQVGTTLTTSVDVTAKTLQVNNLTVSDGNNTYELFVPGDTAVIEGESVKVLTVDKAHKTLTVERGFVRPASAHTAGTRIAAHITFWPDSWLLNLSTLSPTATIDPVYGTERWGDYNARVGARLVQSNPDWDGLLIDRADPNQSWLIGGSNARTIDPDQSNTLLTDYSEFDASWNEGLRNYMTKLREALGVEVILFTNWGMNNYDLVNGNNYEGFPLDDGSSYRENWHETVFGSIADVGSYQQWMEKGLQPNLTMIETYEDDSSPEFDDISYTNPCTQAGFVPDYRKMRFGLTTALLNDGFFSWEINTNGHGSLCLKWFDEYDNSGEQRGYLGQPLGSAYRALGQALGTDRLTAGTFNNESELSQWEFWADPESGNRASISVVTGSSESNGAARVTIAKTTGSDWQISLSYHPVKLEAGSDYTLSFKAKADRKYPITFWSQKPSPPWISYFSGTKDLDTNWQQYEYTVHSNAKTVNAEFTFGLGQSTGTVWIDDVHLQQGSRDVWQRDFSGGSVLVNATNEAKTVNLGRPMRKIKGRQDPEVNDGRLVSKVILPPLDGLILLSATSDSCASSATVLQLPAHQWWQISLPCLLPPRQQTVQDVFADDLEGRYGIDWSVYSFDSVNNTYFDVGLNGILQQGVGYWIIHSNRAGASIDMPLESMYTKVLQKNQCTGDKACYQIPLVVRSERNQLNMLGYPFPAGSHLRDWRIVTRRGHCTEDCTFDQAKSHHIADNTLWHYTGTGYQRLQADAVVSQWEGFWINVLAGASGLEPVLEMPLE